MFERTESSLQMYSCVADEGDRVAPNHRGGSAQRVQYLISLTRCPWILNRPLATPFSSSSSRSPPLRPARSGLSPLLALVSGEAV